MFCRSSKFCSWVNLGSFVRPLSKKLCSKTRRENLRLIRTREREREREREVEQWGQKTETRAYCLVVRSYVFPLLRHHCLLQSCAASFACRAASSSFILPLGCPLYEEKSFFASAKCQYRNFRYCLWWMKRNSRCFKFKVYMPTSWSSKKRIEFLWSNS